MTTKKAATVCGTNVQTRLTPEQVRWLTHYGDGSAPAGIRRLVSAAMAEQHHDPLIALGGLIGRAAAMYAMAAQRHSAHPPQTPAGSTATPGQQQPPSLTAPAPAELTGFEGWDE